MAELEAALQNLLDTITRSEKAIQDTAGLPMIAQISTVIDCMTSISRADTRYRRARENV